MSADPMNEPKSTGKLDAKVPAGPLKEKWDKYRGDMKLVNPANKRNMK